MSSLTTHKPLAICFKNVSKIYRLHGSQGDQLIDVLGLHRFGFKTKAPTKEFVALDNISLDVPRGNRIGIIGRNGAGKTTLLKLICGNFSPSHGNVDVNGTVQALMSVGLGFHPEFTGRENVEASLQYNGLNKTDYQQAMNGIIEFCELGEFLDQPFKTYSLGMQARLMFAAATAIRPDILIVDEVLGAGDAYFVAKSKARVENLVGSGCTMLLVSHSMQQVLELCDEVIWLENGKIKMQGEPFLIVKAYEEALHGRLNSITTKNISRASEVILDTKNKKSKSLTKTNETVNIVSNIKRFELPIDVKLQNPNFTPHSSQPIFHKYFPNDIAEFDFVAPGGISRWDAEKGVKLLGFSIQTERGFENKIFTLKPAKFIFSLIGEVSTDFCCRYGIVINDLKGTVVARIYSPPDQFSITVSEIRIIEILFNPVQLGPGEYTLGISILEATELELINSAKRYDLLGRSFSLTVELEETLNPISANFIHSAEWTFHKAD